MQSKCLDVHHSVSLEVGHVILGEYYNIKEKAREQEWSLLWKFQRALCGELQVDGPGRPRGCSEVGGIRRSGVVL